MANQGAKKRKEENDRHMARLLQFIIAANLLTRYNLHTMFVQVMSVISDKFWYTYLAIPAFGAYKSYGFIKGFLSHGSGDEAEDENTRKKREKLEKRASRGKFIKTRTR